MQILVETAKQVIEDFQSLEEDNNSDLVLSLICALTAEYSASDFHENVASLIFNHALAE